MKYKINPRESYQVLGLSTAHLYVNEDDVVEMCKLLETNMVRERDTGWFFKFYEEPENMVGQIEGFSAPVRALLVQCHQEGYRMVEFDRDAEQVFTQEIENEKG